MRGLSMTEAALSRRTGVPESDIRAFRSGRCDDDQQLRKVATALNLDPEALVHSAAKSWLPAPVSLKGLAMFTSLYRSDMTVNAYLIWDPETHLAAAFDTGTDTRLLTDFIGKHDLKLTHIFLTHTHGDHVAGLDNLRHAAPDATVHANKAEPWPGAQSFLEGTEFSLGKLTIGTRTTSGHSQGGTTYVIQGLARPVAVVGDALFAGSMGGGMVSYADALKTNREKIFTLPDNTVLCPGHGPMTTVAQEKQHNPFFPEFKN